MADEAPSSATSVEVRPALPARNPLKRFYHWILSWAHSPYGSAALAVFAFFDSSLFPIPPLFLQVALSLERPRRAFWYAFINTTASVLGACLGYVIGYALYDSVGRWVVDTWGMRPQFDAAGAQFRTNAFVFVLMYSFLPFPYKVITIGSGFVHASLPTLLLASVVGRGFRFFLLGAMCYFWGPRVRTFIERYFNAVCLAIGVLVVLVLLTMKLGPGLLGRP